MLYKVYITKDIVWILIIDVELDCFNLKINYNYW